ncbi:D-inositol-3-phosphate glycosyltransferase [compost metagenome]
MACGIPTVGSIAGGIPELVSHGETGFLAPIGDTRQMADYCVSMLNNPKLMKIMKEACLDRAKNDFSSERIMAEYESIYYRVLNKEVKV